MWKVHFTIQSEDLLKYDDASQNMLIHTFIEVRANLPICESEDLLKYDDAIF